MKAKQDFEWKMPGGGTLAESRRGGAHGAAVE
jgi:hypothetical protein